MNFEPTDRVKDLVRRVKSFMDEHIYPIEREVDMYNADQDNYWTMHPKLEAIKAKAKEQGLWNMFLPSIYPESPGFTNLEYAPIAEELGKVPWASELFNCNAPDTGNMEVFAKYASDALKEKYLKPMLAGEIASAFLMTEPEVASSDATNIQTSIVRDGDEYVINGRKWFSSNAKHPDFKVCVVMGKTDPSASRHQQQSMIIVPADAKGLKIERHLNILGNAQSPEGHAEITLTDVRVPLENILLGEGRGFEIAQGRLGPGRIHHCMRMIGQAQRSLELMSKRVTERTTFGKKLMDYSSIRFDIAKSQCEIESARLLTMKAAWMMDKEGNKLAADHIAMIKIICPDMLIRVTERAMQAHGGMGLTQDTPLANYFLYAKTLKFADGPDEVHMYQLGKKKIKEYSVKPNTYI
jgi:acyl-CoA dehydrogenase